MQVKAMGGRNSRHYLEFQKFCCKAYLILRKHAGLFLKLLDLSKELNNTTHNGLSFRSGQELVERFQLHLSPQEAVAYLQDVIHESLARDAAGRWRWCKPTPGDPLAPEDCL